MSINKSYFCKKCSESQKEGFTCELCKDIKSSGKNKENYTNKMMEYLNK